MSHYPLVKFVDSPAVGATVRLDLNDGAASASRRIEADIDWGVPTIEGEPDAVGQAFGFRSPRFTVQVKGTKANTQAFVSALSKELLRRTNWLMFQLDSTSSPRWVKTYRTGYESLSFAQVFGNTTTGAAAPAGFPDVWRVEVPLVAEALAYGARETIPTVQIVQAPADLAGPTRYAMRYILPAIKGDAPTNLRVRVTPAGGTALDFAAKWLLSCASGDATMAHAIADIGTGDGFTAGAGTGAGAANAAYFGGSYRAVSIGAATPNLLSRLTGNLPVVPLGRYKIQLRCVLPTPTVGKTLLAQMLLTSAGGGTSYGSIARFDLTGFAATVREFWLDLGDFTIPFGITPPADAGPTPGAVGFQINMGTAEGTAVTVNIDSIKLIPIDGPNVSQARTLTSVGPNTIPLTNGVAGVFDGDTESYWSYNTGTNVFYVGRPAMAGSYLIADPAAAQNILTVMAVDGDDSAAATIASLGQLAALDVSYCPRFLHVGDGT